MIVLAEKKEPIPSAKVRREVEAILGAEAGDKDKLKALLRLYRREQSVKTRSSANVDFLRDRILTVSGGSFEAIAASMFTQGYCTEAAYYLQGEKATAAYAKLETLLGGLSKSQRRKIFQLVRVPFLKVDWELLQDSVAKLGKPKLYGRARTIVGTYLRLTVEPLTKKVREGK